MVVMVCLLVVEEHANACRAHKQNLWPVLSYFMGM